MEYAAIIGALVQAVPAVVDLVNEMQSGGAKKAEIDKALSELAKQHNLIPTDAELHLEPQEIDAIASGQVTEARKSALAGISKMAQNGGMDDESRYAINQARQEAEANQRSANANIESQLRRSGGYSQGTAALLQQAASADANNAFSQAGQQAASEARKRALQAMMSQGQMANQIDDAERARQEFNAKMRQASDLGNVANKMDLSKMRLDSAGSLYDAKMGGAAGKQAIDDRSTKALYGATAQAGGVFKEIQNKSNNDKQAAIDERRYQDWARSQGVQTSPAQEDDEE